MTEKSSSKHEQFREQWILAVMKDEELSSGEKVVLIRLIMFRNRKDGMAWPTNTTLAEDCRTSESTVRRATGKAEDRFLKRVQKGTGGQASSKNQTNKWSFLIPSNLSTSDGVQEAEPLHTRPPSKSNPFTSEISTPSPVEVNPFTSDHLTTEGTTDKEPLNNNLTVVDAGDFDGDFSEEDPVPLDEWRAATGLFAEPSFGIPVLEEEPPLPPEPVDEEPSVPSGPF